MSISASDGNNFAPYKILVYQHTITAAESAAGYFDILNVPVTALQCRMLKCTYLDLGVCFEADSTIMQAFIDENTGTLTVAGINPIYFLDGVIVSVVVIYQ